MQIVNISKSVIFSCLFIQVLVPIHLVCADVQETPGLSSYQAEERDEYNEFQVYLPAAYTDQELPIVFFGHPNGGNAAKEMNQWKQRAEEFPFIAVTFTFKSSKHSDFIKDDEKYVEEVIDRVSDSLRFDAEHVYFTAHSGGGYAGWQVIAKEHDKFFTGLCMRSANCFVEILDLPRSWKKKPIYVFWGEHDAKFTAKQNPGLVKYLEKELRAKNLKAEIIPGGKHKSHPEKFITWLAEQTGKTAGE